MLCDSDRLERTGVGAYRDDGQRSRNDGRINAALAHGVTGLAAALCSALETVQAPGAFALPSRVCADGLLPKYLSMIVGFRPGLPPCWKARATSGDEPTTSVALRNPWHPVDSLGCGPSPLWCTVAGLCRGRSFCRTFDEQRDIDEGPLSAPWASAMGRYAHHCGRMCTVCRTRGRC